MSEWVRHWGNTADFVLLWEHSLDAIEFVFKVKSQGAWVA